jgi:hypothetical protein
MMPRWDCKCPECGHEDKDLFAKMSESETLRCTRCNAVTTRIPALISEVGRRRLYGKASRSLMEGWNPCDVEEAKRLVGPDLEHCIDDLGQVSYADEGERKRYIRKIEQLEETKKKAEAEERQAVKEAKRAAIRQRANA